MATPISRDIRQDLADAMPRYYDGSYVIGNVLDREAEELVALNDAAYDVLAQFFVDTATWGLSRWERTCGITTDVSKSTEQRRAVIRSKLRGMGTVTVAMIKSVAESFDNGAVNVTENNAAYTIEVKFVSTRGVPTNLTDIQTALRDIIPAHLAINFSFTYLTFGELESAGLTFGTWQSKGLTFGALETWNPTS